ncbi:MAG: DUF4393 domain-containing protein [Defluviitaleaceae bacterium]|nr:DUF4393 domain-containing protein [Defluviitaleaceae bacterium]
MDDKEFKLIKEVAATVAKESYQDVGRPVLEPTGKTLALLPRTIKASLLPLEKWVLRREYNLAETEKMLEQKLQNVNPDQISAPEVYIGVPALQYISYCMDSKELRDMYAELLAKSMNESTRKGVHPGYVEIIKQLCPDEAKIMRVMEDVLPVITLRYANEKGRGVEILRNFSDIGEKANCEYPSNISQYIDNLERLGIITLATPLSTLIEKSLYDPLKNHPSIKSVERRFMSLMSSEELSEYKALIDGEPLIKVVESYYKITDFGRSFKAICITPIT